MMDNLSAEWGKRFAFPENVKTEITEDTAKIIYNREIEMAEQYDDLVIAEIAKAARLAGMAEVTVLNKKAILDALNKQIPKKPIFVDTRFRNHGRSVADGVSLAKCYKCPTCWSHIFHVWDSEKYCVHCGQALDWENADGQREKTV